MIPVRLLMEVEGDGKKTFMIRDVELPAIPVPKVSSIYLQRQQPSDAKWDEYAVSRDGYPIWYMEGGPVVVHIDTDEVDSENEFEEWIKHLIAFGWRESKLGRNSKVGVGPWNIMDI